MNKKQLNLEKYKSTLDLLIFEAQFLWTIFSTFLLVHTIFLGFLVQNAFKENLLFNYNLPCFISGLIGFSLILPWYGTYKRNSDFYQVRMAQSRESEPKNWKLISNTGQKFADGGKVVVDGKTYKISYWGRILRNKISIPILIIVFAIVYLLIVISSGPWNEEVKDNNKIKCYSSCNVNQ